MSHTKYPSNTDFEKLITWCGETAYEKKILLQAAKRHGIRSDEHGITALTKFCDGTVVALGEMARDAAILYAELTCRKYLTIQNTFDLLDLRDVHVIVTTSDYLLPELFDIIQWINPAFTPGLIYAEKQELKLRCMVCAMAVHGEIQDRTCLEYYNNSLNPVSITITEENSESEKLKQLISQQYGLLVMQIHCDGIDSYLSKETVLCARPEDTVTSGGHLCGRCYTEDWCYRKSLALSDPKLKMQLLVPSMMQSGILLFDVCWGLLPPSGVVHPRYGVGYALARNTGISAIVSTWRPVLHSPNMIDQLITDIKNGTMLGTAVARHNASQLSQTLDHAFCIFGDPTTRLNVVHSPLIEKKINTTKVFYDAGSAAVEKKPLPQEVIALKHFIHSPLLEYDGLPNLQLALSNVESLMTQKTDANMRSATKVLQDEMIKILCEDGPKIDKHWMYDASVSYVSTSSHACLCGNPPVERLVTFNIDLGGKGAHRVMSLCQRCGIAEDMDPRLDARVVALDNNILNITGLSKTADSRVVAILKGQLKGDRTIINWPADATGQYFANDFQLPAVTSTGVMQIGVIVMEDLKFSVFSFIVPAKLLTAANLHIPYSG